MVLSLFHAVDHFDASMPRFYRIPGILTEKLGEALLKLLPLKKQLSLNDSFAVPPATEHCFFG